MKQENDLLARKVQKLMDYCEHYERGATISHRKITEVTNEPYKGAQWGQMIRKWEKRLLKERNVALKNEHGHGYKLATIEEQLNEIPIRHQEKGIKQYKSGRKKATAIPVDNLTDNQRLIQTKRAQGMTTVMKGMRKELKVQRALIAPQEQLHQTSRADFPASSAVTFYGSATSAPLY
jgi:hypothetical protein